MTFAWSNIMRNHVMIQIQPLSPLHQTLLCTIVCKNLSQRRYKSPILAIDLESISWTASTVKINHSKHAAGAWFRESRHDMAICATNVQTLLESRFQKRVSKRLEYQCNTNTIWYTININPTPQTLNVLYSHGNCICHSQLNVWWDS